MRPFLWLKVVFFNLCPPSNFLVITIQNNCENSVSGGQIFTGKNVITQMCLPTDTKVVCRKAQADKDLTEEQAVQYGDQDAEQRADKHL